MRVPDDVLAAYEEALAVIDVLKTTAEPRLRILCEENGWLFDQRIKSPESALSKLEAGGEPLKSMPDLWATQVVVPTREHLNAAVGVVLERFDGEIKPPRTLSPEAFKYDDIHLRVRLGSRIPPRSVVAEVIDRDFEVQVRTGLQYAWWRATHDQLYKGGPEALAQPWGVRRAVGQTRAALEMLDSVLADLPSAGKMQDVGPPPGGADLEALECAAWLSLWRGADRPADVVRFSSTALALLRACALTVEAVSDYVQHDDFRSVIAEAPQIGPGQAVVVAVDRMAGSETVIAALKGGSRRVLVTPTMVRVHPPFGDYPQEVQVNP
ncbi:hypothetical protein [Pseudokineococcus lusitanus]|uniref:RelA/SpoT family protein n=1 Tax=Pseudokineococcus lusitanus TaxID=763993 RepID=A0A3N1GWH3_9ACTN|nr:hypothetical protein [Pseudokineococcus lusitanus]ROP34600.1 RelA/SpoT family protein [Pseudokineococcus lusitanus]